MLETKEKRNESQERWHLLRDKYVKEPKVAFLLEKFRRWLQIRNQEMEYLMYAIAHSRPLFDEIGAFLGLSHQEIWNSSRHRLDQAFAQNNPHLARDIQHEHLVIYHDKGIVHLRSDLTVLLGVKEEVKDLKGKKVFGQGVIQAKVFVAYSLNDLADLDEKGENRILVTGMTTPDFIPHLKKPFCALITDEGGILCHAAIIARENKIPCLVGTGIATERLKTGMEIILDLDREMVRIFGA